MIDAHPLENDMRTTLAINDDVLIVAKAMAAQQRRSLGEVISGLARKSLPRPRAGASATGFRCCHYTPMRRRSRWKWSMPCVTNSRDLPS